MCCGVESLIQCGYARHRVGSPQRQDEAVSQFTVMSYQGLCVPGAQAQPLLTSCEIILLVNMELIYQTCQYLQNQECPCYKSPAKCLRQQEAWTTPRA